MRDPVVFISYSHDSDAHRERVLALSERLRADGVETVLDRYVKGGSPPEGWPRWMMNGLDRSTHVLCVCTETYCRRFLGREEPGMGKGVDWEGALLTQELYDARSRTHRFVAVVFHRDVEAHVPEPLRGQTYYVMDSETEYEAMYDALLAQSGVEPGPVGELKRRPRRVGQPLAFGNGDSGSKAACPVDLSHFDVVKYAPAELIGREEETRLLDDAWEKVKNSEPERAHVLTFVAMGGEGKTSLVADWAARLAHRDWPGCEAVFAWSFYSQGATEKSQASSDLFLKNALEFFGDAELANSAQSAHERGRRLATLVGAQRALLILDGLEPLQYAPTSPMRSELKDQGIAALLKGLAASCRGLCVVTTRYSIRDLRAYRQTTAPEVELRRLSHEAGVALLRSLGVRGMQLEFETLVEDVKGHALTLNLLGTYLRDAHGGDIRRRDRVKLEEADVEEQGGHAFRVMDAYVTALESGGKSEADNERGRRALALLRLLGLFDRPASADCLEALWTGEPIVGFTEPIVGLGEDERNEVLQGLEEARLLTANQDSARRLIALDAHPLIREYFARRLRDELPEAYRAAHRRVYEHLCATTTEGASPTVDDLQPLYQAVAHGCQAGLVQEACDDVYFARIQRGLQHYSWHKLGAFGSELGAQACFFKRPWSILSPALAEVDKAWLLNEAAYCLRAVGRLTEALELMGAGLDMRIEHGSWKNAAINASNLSELEVTLGEVASAVRDAEQSVTYADRSGDEVQRMLNRAMYADALHQAGRRSDAQTSLCEAEAMQTERQPEYPLLYSLQGFRYCDLLLAAAERAAWQQMLASGVGGQPVECVVHCEEVEQRATKTLQWAEQNNLSLLTIALEHLTLGRAALYKAILERTEVHDLRSRMRTAVDGLRRAGTMHELPRGLLTRAWLLHLDNNPAASRDDLDEAWEIAERGPMPLFQADIHLHRARLFGRKTNGDSAAFPYPWTSPAADLREARRLITKHGYGRRIEELEDAERALLRGHREDDERGDIASATE